MNRREMFSRPTEYRTDRRSARPRTTGEAIADAIEDGKFDKAAQLYFNERAIHP